MSRTRAALAAALLLLGAGCSSDEPAAAPSGLPTSAPRLDVDGSYRVVLTVVESGAEAEPVGSTTSRTWTVDVDCPTLPCTGTLTSDSGTVYDVRWDGTTMTGSGTSTEAGPCPRVPELALSFQPGDGGAVAMDGRRTTSLSPDAGSGPCTVPPPATVVSGVSGTRDGS